MLDAELELRKSLREIAPQVEDRTPDWAAVLRDARSAPLLRWGRRAVVPLAAAVVAVLVFVLVSPFGSSKGGVLDRALAAVGDGSVVHLVLREEWGGTLVDLESGRRTALHGEREVWYDPQRGLHDLSRFAGVVQSDIVYRPEQVPHYLDATYAGAAEGYRDALASGKARVLGKGRLDGTPVYWIRVDTELVPEGDGQHEWAHDVAVSQAGYEPMYFRTTRDGKPGPDTGARVLELKTLAAGEGDFRADPVANPLEGAVARTGNDPIPLAEAGATIGRPALWLGSRFEKLPLTQVTRIETTTGHEVVERDAVRAGALEREQSEACRARKRIYGDNPAPHERAALAACEARLEEYRQGLVRRTRWEGEAIAGVRFAYGDVVDSLPAEDGRPFVTLTETSRRDPTLERGAIGYTPPSGSVIVFGPIGRLYRDGVYVSIDASSAELVLAAARALEPMP